MNAIEERSQLFCTNLYPTDYSSGPSLCLFLSPTLERGEPSANVLDGRRSDCATRHSAALRVVALARTRCTRGSPPHHQSARQAPPTTRLSSTVTSNPTFHSSGIYRGCCVLRHRHLHFARARRVARSSAPFVALSLHSRVARSRGSHASLLS